jgi:hypothetical protein
VSTRKPSLFQLPHEKLIWNSYLRRNCDFNATQGGFARTLRINHPAPSDSPRTRLMMSRQITCQAHPHCPNLLNRSLIVEVSILRRPFVEVGQHQPDWICVYDRRLAHRNVILPPAIVPRGGKMSCEYSRKIRWSVKNLLNRSWYSIGSPAEPERRISGGLM